MRSSLTILIVDDDPAVLGCVAECLERVGHVCHRAGTADEALAIAVREPIQATILDLHIRGRTGLDTLPRLRSIHAALPAILMSGSLSTEIRREARRLGFRAVLSKPLDLGLLRGALDGIAV